MKKLWQESYCWVWLMVLWLVVMASLVWESKAAPCGSTFVSTIIQLLPCRPAVSAFRPFPPTEACCAAVRSLGQPCLCAVVNGPPIIGVDRNMALQLPDKCTANFEPCELGK
ncbi:PREDICTED: putative lipid-transfer protein DIR1 [Ipomoea nil]|uniref:putative lipid-transfer protein DIR1 n=1 Tax=Ipomoea nil TaxID=35883 RepID=UPI000901A1D8|nr:PREDICTED: putative lipid-transfer protein DIR1 [Ipomoea nil]